MRCVNHTTEGGGRGLHEPIYTLVPCWMSKLLPPKTECMHSFAPSWGLRHGWMSRGRLAYKTMFSHPIECKLDSQLSRIILLLENNNAIALRVVDQHSFLGL